MNEIDQYIQNYPDEVQYLLKQVRSLIRELAPGTEECLSYGIPTFKTYGKTPMHFDAFKKHLGFLCHAFGVRSLCRRAFALQTGQRLVQFPLNKPIPFGLIRRMVAFPVKENSAQTE